MTKTRLKFALSALLSAVVLVGCGFHLRDHAALPADLQPIHIGGSASQSIIAREIRLLLDSESIEVTPPSLAKYLLLLNDVNEEQRIVSVDRRGRIAEYGLSSGVTFELTDRNGKTVFGPQHVAERRSVINNPDNVITTNEELRLTREEMNRAVAASVLRRLGAFQPGADPATEPDAAADAPTDTVEPTQP